MRWCIECAGARASTRPKIHQQSLEELCLAIEQRDQLRIDGGVVRAQIRKFEKHMPLRRRPGQICPWPYPRNRGPSRKQFTVTRDRHRTELITEIQSREVGYTEEILDLHSVNTIEK
jgi:hypothetical protein